MKQILQDMAKGGTTVTEAPALSVWAHELDELPGATYTWSEAAKASLSKLK